MNPIVEFSKPQLSSQIQIQISSSNKIPKAAKIPDPNHIEAQIQTHRKIEEDKSDLEFQLQQQEAKSTSIPDQMTKVSNTKVEIQFQQQQILDSKQQEVTGSWNDRDRGSESTTTKASKLTISRGEGTRSSTGASGGNSSVPVSSGTKDGAVVKGKVNHTNLQLARAKMVTRPPPKPSNRESHMVALGEASTAVIRIEGVIEAADEWFSAVRGSAPLWPAKGAKNAVSASA
ncbi:hypothetical protein PIB30_060465 [Stylosanthes scabra]|uniref:Uncharacterized protein n=1 Tax=Stylosanthes scabra TaxID=79078 RepID=A0ABU6RKJ4_9FABA|nr:hypothetical protein [Stylosanthes scabra]